MNNNDDNKGDIDMLLPRRNYNLFDEFFDNDFWGKGFSKFEAPSMKKVMIRRMKMINTSAEREDSVHAREASLSEMPLQKKISRLHITTVY